MTAAPSVVAITAPGAAEGPVEIAERKGVGHPDTVCDALAEAFSRALGRFYLERFGAILHHNVDKALLAGGAARAAFGGGEVLEPIELFLAGRAVRDVRGAAVPVDALGIEAARDWLRAHLPELDVERHVRIRTLVRPTSADLDALFASGAGAVPRANDTSFGVGFAPLDALERAVLAAEAALNAPATKATHPEIGPDVKVMGARTHGAIALTVACAFVGRHVADAEAYRHSKAKAAALALAAAREAAGSTDVTVVVNAADGAAPESLYLTVTGTSAEAGDDGQVGRGNRANGLITPYRPMSLEAIAGKNPVSHVGKLYGVMANRVADAVVAEVPEVAESACWLLSRIGTPIDAPQLFDVKVRLRDPAALEGLRPRIAAVAGDAFRGVTTLWRDALEGTLPVC